MSPSLEPLQSGHLMGGIICQGAYIPLGIPDTVWTLEAQPLLGMASMLCRVCTEGYM